MKANGDKNFSPMFEFAEGFKAYSSRYPNFNVKLAYLKKPNSMGEMFEIRYYPKGGLNRSYLTDDEERLVNDNFKK